jgi:ABC-2 type transport system ATP-binding protein
MIELVHITKYYGDRLVLKDINVRMEQPGVIGLLGQNGAGKTTLMNLITGYHPPSEGRILIDGVDLSEKPKMCKKKIGYLPEKPPLYGELSVMQYLNFIFDAKQCRLERATHLRDVCQKAGIDHVQDRIIRNLSKGYGQRIGLAQALVGDPAIMVFDEPSIGLDPVQGKELRRLIRELGRTRIVLVSSHQLTEIQEFADEIIVLHHGILAERGTVAEVSERLLSVRRLMIGIRGNSDGVSECITSAAPVDKVVALSPRMADESMFQVDYSMKHDLRSPIVQALVHQGYDLVDVHEEPYSLEETFLKLMEES